LSHLKFKLTSKKSEQPFTIVPKYVQIQAALYLGCKRLSVFSYSEPIAWANKVEWSLQAIRFWKIKDHIKIFQKQMEVSEEMLLSEERGDLITISILPSCTRLCVNVILLPEPS